MKNFCKILVGLVVFFTIFTNSFAVENVLTVEQNEEISEIFKAKVARIINEELVTDDFSGKEKYYQTLEIKPLSFPKDSFLESQIEDGQSIMLSNDFLRLEKGDKIFVNYQKVSEELEFFSVNHLDRTGSLLTLLLFFFVVLIVFTGRQGFRSIASLLGSFFVIFYILIPLILSGYSPLVVGVGISITILAIAIYLTHGVSKQSSLALAGTSIAVVITGFIAFLSVSSSKLSGYFSDESTYLDIATTGIIDFQALLLAGMIIAVLGILDDIAITQVAVVGELKKNSHKNNWEIYKSAMKVGKEHSGALVNTLILVYAGVSLPLLLLMDTMDHSFLFDINQETIATEIVRTLVGSIGLILTVPITTILAVRFIKKSDTIIEHNHHH